MSEYESLKAEVVRLRQQVRDANRTANVAIGATLALYILVIVGAI